MPENENLRISAFRHNTLELVLCSYQYIKAFAKNGPGMAVFLLFTGFVKFSPLQIPIGFGIDGHGGAKWPQSG